MVSTMILTCSGPTQPPSKACASSGNKGAAVPPVINSRGRIWAAALTLAAASAAEMVKACRSSVCVEEHDRSFAMPS